MNDLEPQEAGSQQRRIRIAINYGREVQETEVISQHHQSNGSERRNFSPGPRREMDSGDEMPAQRKESFSSEGLNLTSKTITTGRSLNRRFKAMLSHPQEDETKQIYLEDAAPAEKMGGRKKPEELQIALEPQNSRPNEAPKEDETFLRKRRRSECGLEGLH